MPTTIYTIGHSNHRAPTFATLLADTGIELLVDTRSKPGSRWAPYTTPPGLTALLDPLGIGYLYLGDKLGGRPDDPSLIRDGKPDYAAMARQPAFLEGLAQLEERSRVARLCIMCSEEDPLRCHRRNLVGLALHARGYAIAHIRKDGRVQPDAALPQQSPLPLE